MARFRRNKLTVVIAAHYCGRKRYNEKRYEFSCSWRFKIPSQETIIDKDSEKQEQSDVGNRLRVQKTAFAEINEEGLQSL